LRILICAVEAPLPPVNGLRLMLTALTRELRRRHDVRVLAFRAGDQSQAGEHDLRLIERPATRDLAGAAHLLKAGLRGRPLTADLLAARMRRPLGEELRGFRPDVVHVASGRLAALGRSLEGKAAVLVALDAWHLNVEARARLAHGLRGRLLRGEAGRVRKFESVEYPRFRRIVVVSDPDRAALAALCPTATISVIPNGVDADRFRPDGASTESPRLVFTGVMSYAPNVAAADFLAREVFPRVRAVVPDATLALVGRSPTPRVAGLSEIPGVEVTGEVPDIRPWLIASSVYVCPMVSGTGIKNKLLEAMASGLPCVATPLALQGLDVRDGREVAVAGDAAGLAAHAVRLLADGNAAERLGQAARQYVRRHHDWSAVARAYEGVYESVVSASRG
jgi:polysaccharide biosynthesis protein PslH